MPQRSNQWNPECEKIPPDLVSFSINKCQGEKKERRNCSGEKEFTNINKVYVQTLVKF